MRLKIFTTVLIVLMIVGACGAIHDLRNPHSTAEESMPNLQQQTLPDEILPKAKDAIAEDIQPGIDADSDIGLALQDKPNHYKTTFEPWKTKAAIHSVAYHEETGFLALGGGYLYDNEVHIWRLNTLTDQFDKVWDSGDGIIRSDVIALSWGDTDLNDFVEVAAASADGYVYLFEQRHLYDPVANTENMFDHVWTSPHTFRAWDVEIYDADRDYREDIIVAGWDGTVRCYEYLNHSDYPFSEEHWITFSEVWNSGDIIDGKVMTLAYGDTNFNGLPEIIAGTYEGRVYVFENDGVHLMINGEPFPLVNDNDYALVWTSKNYTWRPIISMDVGELDDSAGEEIALIAQGQGAFILNWNEFTESYSYERVFEPWEAWQTSEESPWRLDYYADAVTTANNVTYRLSNGTHIPEPINYVHVGGGDFKPDAECYPYNTGMANASDGYYSYFNADEAPNATAVIDFGKDEEGTGSASIAWDIGIFLDSAVDVSKVNISIGQSPTDFERVKTENTWIVGNNMYVDVDYALGRKHWDWFRYMQITVFGGEEYHIDAIRLNQVYTQITTAISVEIGPLPEEFNPYGEPENGSKVIVATSIGSFYAFRYGSPLELVWDSARDDEFSVGTNVWDMEFIGFGSKLPIWLKGEVSNYMDPSNGVYQHWSVGDLDHMDLVGGRNPHHAIMTDSEGNIDVFSPSGPTLEWDAEATSYFAAIEAHIDLHLSSLETAQLGTGGLPRAFVGRWNNPDPDELYGDKPDSMAAQITVFDRPSSTDPFSMLTDIRRFDYTGRIVDALGNAKTVPRMDFVDWDDDGDLDMILSTGFVYYCENIGYAMGPTYPQLVLREGYFSDINTDSMNAYWGQPDSHDFDQDGDMDLLLSYDGRMGATAWFNDGTVDEPDWTERKELFSNRRPETNLKYNSFTDLRVIPNGWGMPQEYWFDIFEEDTMFDDADYTVMGYKTDTFRAHIFFPVYDQSASYVVATYPTVSRYQFAIQSIGNNFGYHVMESWNTEDDLEEWTLTIRSGDVDDDGNGEIIVGDYDNNVYVFEHMLNNTYKRAFRSFDLNHTEVSDTSPYMWEELEGISGTFDRVIWDHAKHLLANVDIDGDDLKELIVSAGLKVYVFEDTGVDDTYQLALEIDLGDEGLNGTTPSGEIIEVTALGAGDDYDLNGEYELVIAAGPYLLVYNVPNDDWAYAAEYFMSDDGFSGRYILLGNGKEMPEAWIDAIALCDTDEDGKREIIIGGRINTTQIREHGFVKIYEWTGATFTEVWDAGPEVTWWNSINSIVLDDQDYDSKQEIIIGHDKGFDIWEWDGGDSSYAKREEVTSSPNYPYIDLRTTESSVSEENNELTDRGGNDLAFFSEDVPWVVDVFCNVSRLYWKVNYYGMIDAWASLGQVITDTYPGYQGALIESEHEPELFYDDTNETLYLTWRTEINDGSTNYDIWAARYSVATGVWSSPVLIGSADNRHYPHMFRYDADTLGVVYVNWASHRLWIKLCDEWGTWSSGSFGIYFKNYADYFVQSVDLKIMPDGGFALAISARNNTLSKTDLDIFVATSNSSWYWTDSVMYRATSSYNNEINPDLSVLDYPEATTLVVYESVEAPIEDRIQMSYSNSLRLWRQEEPLATLPNYVDRVEGTDGEITYWFNNSLKVLAPAAFSPSVIGLRGGGFMYTHAFDFFTPQSTTTPFQPAAIREYHPYASSKYPESADLVYGINPSSNFTHFNIGGVVDMDVGDTDGDARREVVVGFEDRIGVYELEHSNLGNEVMRHREAHLSRPFAHDVTGITVYDSNGNTFEEIGVSCRRGEVFVLEVDNTALGKVPLLHSESLWSSTLGGPAFGSDTVYGSQVAVYDVDADGLMETIRGETNGVVRCFDDDGSELWANDLYNDGVFWIDVDSTNAIGTMPYVVVTRYPSAMSSYTNVTFLSALTGNTHWHKTIPNYPLFPYSTAKIADVTGVAVKEVIVTNTLNQVFVYNMAGTHLWNTSLPLTLSSLNIATGNFSTSDTEDIAVVHTNGSLTVLNGTGLEVIFHLEGKIGYDYLEPAVSDIDGDGWDDIVTARKNLFVVDAENRSILYNSTNYLADSVRQVFLGDYDLDNQTEALLVTDYQVVMEDIATGRFIWSYRITDGEIEDAMMGTFGANRTGIAFCTDMGAVVALDAWTGFTVYFAVTDNEYNEILAGDFDGDGLAELGASDGVSGDIHVFNEVKPNITEIPGAYDLWSLYWNNTLGVGRSFRITGIWTRDVDYDGVTEFVVGTNDNKLRLYEPVSNTLKWTYDAPGDVVEVEFANLAGNTTVDILCLCKESGSSFVVGVDGVDGTELDGINEKAPAGYTITAMGVGNLRSTISGIEYVVLYTQDSTNETGIAIYDNNGFLRFGSGTNASSFYPTHMVIGKYIAGDLSNDAIAIGGIKTGNRGMIYLYEGNGAFYWSGPPVVAPFIVDMKTGYLDGDGYDDIAIAWENGYVWSWSPGTSTLFWEVPMNATIDALTLANYNPSRDDEEIVINLREQGIVVSDGDTYTEQFRFEANTTIPKWVDFVDVNGDDDLDMVLLFEEHFAIIDPNDEAIYGGYVAGTTPNSLHIGNFDGTGPLDVIFSGTATIYCVTNHTMPPPKSPSTAPRGISSLARKLLEVSVGLMPVTLIALVVIVKTRWHGDRKRRIN